MSQRRSTSGNRSGEAGVVQPAMFVYRVDQIGKRLALSDGTPRWQYPCGLCNGRLVTEPGALCSVCAPVAPRSRRKTAKPRTRKTTEKAEPEGEQPSSGRPRSKRTPPWERVASARVPGEDGGAEITCSFCGHRDTPTGMAEHWCEGRRRFVDGGEPS